MFTSAIVTLAALAMTKLKLIADFLKIIFPALSAFHPRMRAKSPLMASSRMYGFPSKVLDYKIRMFIVSSSLVSLNYIIQFIAIVAVTSFGKLLVFMVPSKLNLIGSPPK